MGRLRSKAFTCLSRRTCTFPAAVSRVLENISARSTIVREIAMFPSFNSTTLVVSAWTVEARRSCDSSRLPTRKLIASRTRRMSSLYFFSVRSCEFEGMK